VSADLDAAMKASRLSRLTAVSGKNSSGGEMGPDQSGGVHWSYVATFSDPPLLLTVSGPQMVLNSISPGPRSVLPHACIDPESL